MQQGLLMITVLGSINIDLVSVAERLPRPGETVDGSRFYASPGGRGANQALAARRAGSKVRMVGAIGSDEFGQVATATLREAGVDLSGVKHCAGSTGTAAIHIGDDGESTVIVVPGANASIAGTQAIAAIEGMSEGDTLLMQMEIRPEAMEAAVKAAKNKGVRTILNVAPMSREATHLACLVDILVASETEFDRLVGSKASSAEERLERLRLEYLRRGQTIVITLGTKGAIAIKCGQIVQAEGLKLSPLDTAGADDTFCGFLASSLDQGLDFPVALRRATVACSFANISNDQKSGVPRIGGADPRS